MGWDGDLREASRSRAGLRQAAAAIAVCLLVANCSSSSKLTSRVDPRYGVAASPRVVEPGQPVPKGGGVYRVGKPYQVAGRHLYAGREQPLPQRRSRLLVRRRFPRPAHRERRNLRHERDLGRASDPADAELCARHQSLDPQIADRARQRSRPLSRATARSTCPRKRRRAARLPPSRHGARARRICRPGAARGHRRPPAGGDLARRRAGARAAS